jgi:hypothetical protein
MDWRESEPGRVSHWILEGGGGAWSRGKRAVAASCPNLQTLIISSCIALPAGKREEMGPCNPFPTVSLRHRPAARLALAWQVKVLEAYESTVVQSFVALLIVAVRCRMHEMIQ